MDILSSRSCTITCPVNDAGWDLMARQVNSGKFGMAKVG